MRERDGDRDRDGEADTVTDAIAGTGTGTRTRTRQTTDAQCPCPVFPGHMGDTGHGQGHTEKTGTSSGREDGWRERRLGWAAGEKTRMGGGTADPDRESFALFLALEPNYKLKMPCLISAALPERCPA